jgi:hypothetical protein
VLLVGWFDYLVKNIGARKGCFAFDCATPPTASQLWKKNQ